MAHNMEQEVEVPIMDGKWADVQQKTFTKWANSHLKKGGHDLISDMIQDLETGVALASLLKTLFGDSVTMPKLNKKGKMRIHLLENCSKAIDMCRELQLSLKGTSSEHLVDHDRKMILGLIWIIILEYQIKGISVEDMSAKDGLLLWCKKKTKTYPVKCDNFHTSWKDGMTLLALIHKHRPDLIGNFEDYDKANAADNLEKAFSVAEEHLNIPRLLDVEDLVDTEKPDERSVMTYISEFFHAFSGFDNVETAARRLENFFKFMKGIDDLKNEYERLAREVVTWIDETNGTLANRDNADDYASSKQNLGDFKAYKAGPKREKLTAKDELEYLFAAIQTKLKSNGRAPYVPPEDLTPDAIDGKFDELASNERDRYRHLCTNMHDVKENLRKEFATAADALFAFCNELKREVTGSPDGDIDARIAASEAVLGRVGEAESQLASVTTISAKLDEALIEENIHCDHHLEDLAFTVEQIAKVANKHMRALQGQKDAAGNKSSVPEEVLQEFHEAFHHFDKNKNGTLEKHEFKGVLAALGKSPSTAEFDELWSKLVDGAEVLTFAQFVEYMSSIAEDKDTAEQVIDSFKVISNNSDVVTEAQMRSAGLSDIQVEYFKTVLPPGGEEGSYKYKDYVEASYQ